MALSGAAVLATTAYLYRLTAASHVAAVGLVAGLVMLMAFGDAMAAASARRVIRWLLHSDPVRADLTGKPVETQLGQPELSQPR